MQYHNTLRFDGICKDCDYNIAYDADKTFVYRYAYKKDEQQRQRVMWIKKLIKIVIKSLMEQKD